MSNTPPTPESPEPLQATMELAINLLRYITSRTCLMYEDQVAIARLIDAHNAGLRREVEEAKAEAEDSRRIVISTRQCATQAMDEIRKIVGAPKGSEDASTKRAADYVSELKADLARLTALADERGKESERIAFLEKHLLSLSRLTAPDMSGVRFVGQIRNPAKERGEAGPSYLRIQGQTLEQTIDDARSAARKGEKP